MPASLTNCAAHDFDSLAMLLLGKGVADADIAELPIAVQIDGALTDPKDGFGHSVKAWMTKTRRQPCR